MRRAILFTGLVRNPDRFNAFLDTIDALEPQQRSGVDVLFSTWTGELNAYPEIAARLEAMKAVVLEQPPPKLILAGHVLHQIACLDLACSLLHDDTYVLKIRSDIGHPPDIHVFLASQPEAQPDGQPLPTALRYRVRHRGVFGAHPLYINDVTFAAMAGDLRHLAKLPYTFGLRYVRMAPEQLYWGAPFIVENPVLDAFFRANFGLIFHDRAQFSALRAALTDSPLYARALAVSAILMRDGFRYLGNDPERDKLRPLLRQYTLEAILWDPLNLPGISSHPTAFTNWFASQGAWDALLAGEYQSSPLGDRFRAALMEYDRPNALACMRDQRSELLSEAANLGARIEATVRQGPLKQIRVAGNKRVIHERPAEWTMAQGDTEYVRKLEREISEYRRLNGEMTDKLRQIEVAAEAARAVPAGGGDPE